MFILAYAYFLFQLGVHQWRCALHKGPQKPSDRALKKALTGTLAGCDLRSEQTVATIDQYSLLRNID